MAVRDRTSHRPVAIPEQITITVGIHGDDGSERHAANDSTNELTVADIGTFHEFGVGPFQVTGGFSGDGALGGHEHPGIPQRSFIRAWYDENHDFIAKTMQAQMKLAISGKITPEVAAERIALAFEGSVKQRISRGIPPPNAQSTIERKGSSKPLIDTGQLRNSIRGRVEIK